MKKECTKCGHEQNVTTLNPVTTCSMCQKKFPVSAIIASLLIVGLFGVAYAEISVYQDNSPEVQEFLKRVSTENITYTKGVGITYPSLSAQVEKYSEDVTVPISHPVVGWNCEYRPHDISPATICVFEGFIASEPEDKFWDEEAQEWKTSEQIQAEYEAQRDEAEQDEIATPEGKWDRRLAELKAIENPTRTQKRIIALLENIDSVCVNDVLQLQTFREYYVAMEKFLDPETGEWKSQLMTKKALTAVDLQNFPALKEARMQIQECIAENTLKTEILTESTFNKVVDDINTYNIYHSDFARDKVTYPQPVTTQQLKDNQKERALLSICSNNYFGSHYRAQMGCQDTTEYDSENPPVPLANTFPTEIQKRINEYNEDGGKSQVQEVIKDKIQKQIAKLKSQLESFK